MTDSNDTSQTNVESRDAIAPNDTKQLDQQMTAAEPSGSSLERLLASINSLMETKLRRDAQLRHQTEKHQELANEWMIAAAVIDRFCFIVFSISLVVGSVMFYLLYSTSS